MSILAITNKIKLKATEHPMVNMCSIGSIELYENKKDIKYPYVNLDIVSSSVTDYVQTHKFRLYVCDRNEPYTAYNKTEIIMNNILKAMEVDSYNIEFFTLNYLDLVNGCFVDFTIQSPLKSNCGYGTLFNEFVLLEDSEFILLENGDLIRTTV